MIVTPYKSLFKLIKIIFSWLFMEINRRCLKIYFLKGDLEHRALRSSCLSILLCIQGCQHDVWASAFAIISNMVINSLWKIVLQSCIFLCTLLLFIQGVKEHLF